MHFSRFLFYIRNLNEQQNPDCATEQKLKLISLDRCYVDPLYEVTVNSFFHSLEDNFAAVVKFTKLGYGRQSFDDEH